MATPNSSFLMSFFILSLCLFCSLEKGIFALQARKTIQSHRSQHTHTAVQVSSLLPASICSPSSKVPNNEATLKVVHKHGPCSQLQANVDHTQILREDQIRVNSINSRLSKKSAAADTRYEEEDATTLPAKSGAILGYGNYIVTVGLGTPKRDLSLVFDTGSDITWTQCEPCLKSCYTQKEAIFDPTKSTSYANVSCTTAECAELKSATGIKPGCSSGTSTCVYRILYGDNSSSVGFFGKERLTLSSSAVIDNFFFGCGQDNEGLFKGIAGLLGLGRNKLSFVGQTAQQYNRYFSYCLPSTSSSTGYLTFGNTGEPSNSNPVKYTPLSTVSGDGVSFYALQVLGISVGGTKLSIPESTFQSPGTIIDSGTVVSRLPAAAYGPLRSEFGKQMKSLGYPSAPARGFLDTCYDLSGYETLDNVPKISFIFGGGTTVDLGLTNVFIASNISQVCLAFAANDKDGDVAIFGNVQQKTFRVVYDIGGGRLGFGPAGC